MAQQHFELLRTIHIAQSAFPPVGCHREKNLSLLAPLEKDATINSIRSEGATMTMQTDSSTTERPASVSVWPTIAFAVAAAILAGTQRLLPHPANMTLLGALALWGGARLQPLLGLGLPLGVWAATDLVLWLTTGWPSFNLFVYSAFVLYGLLGLTLRNTGSPLRIGAVTVLGSLLFFLITNFGEWLANRVDTALIPAGQYYVLEKGNYPFPMLKYADNVQGLVTCYALGLPFYGQDAIGQPVPLPLGFLGNVILGDLVFSGLLFGAYALLLRRLSHRREGMLVQPS
jgi:hypothetical protein